MKKKILCQNSNNFFIVVLKIEIRTGTSRKKLLCGLSWKLGHYKLETQKTIGSSYCWFRYKRLGTVPSVPCRRIKAVEKFNVGYKLYELLGNWLIRVIHYYTHSNSGTNREFPMMTYRYTVLFYSIDHLFE